MFEYTEDGSGVCTGVGYGGPCGVAIDNVVFKYVPVISAPCAPAANECCEEHHRKKLLAGLGGRLHRHHQS